MVSKINSLFDKEYEYYCNDLTDNSEYDKLKMNVQRNTIIDESYFLEHKLKDVKKYIELIESGKKKEALKFFKSLEAKENKTDNDVLVLKIINRNKSLYNIKNKWKFTYFLFEVVFFLINGIIK